MELPGERLLGRMYAVEAGLTNLELPVSSMVGVVTYFRADDVHDARLVLRIEFAYGGMAFPIDVEHAEALVGQLQEGIRFVRAGGRIVGDGHRD